MWLEIPDKFGISEETCAPLRELKKHIELHEMYALFTEGMQVVLDDPERLAEYGDLGVGVVRKVNPDPNSGDGSMYRTGIYVSWPKVARVYRFDPRDLKIVSADEAKAEAMLRAAEQPVS